MASNPNVAEVLRQFLAQIYTQRTMEEAGNMSIALINLRVQSGIDLSGNPFDAYTKKYLELKIFGLKKAHSRAKKKFLKSEDETTRDRSYRRMTGLDTKIGSTYSGRVDLTQSGKMLRDMHTNVTRDIQNVKYSVEVGYIDGKSPVESIDKARWHNTDGAGKRKVKRTFVGLTNAERDQMLAWFQR